jgi:GT2 family glycosyltransferase
LDISVVVVTHDSEHCISDCLEAAVAQVSQQRVVVVDNASTDATLDRVHDLLPGSQIVENDRNLGFGRACNRGAHAARTRHLLFVNPDVCLTAIPSASALPRDRPCGIVVGQVSVDGRTNPQTRREQPMVLDFVRETLGFLLPRRLSPLLNPSPRPAHWGVGALLLVRREEFLDVGGFDPRYFLFYEDRDLGARYRAVGLPIRELSGLRGSHSEGASSHGATTAIRQAWSLLSWIEYVAAAHGTRIAKVTWLASRTALVLADAVLGAATRVSRSTKVSSKRVQLREVRAFATCPDSVLPDAEPPFLPVARRLVCERRQD